jgi:carbonic anhydrase/SulP family sulfate permease
MAVVLSCIDSRTPPEIIFDLGLGDIFSVRVAGNIVTPEVLGSIEFGCVGAGAKLIVVVGHKRCVAVQSAIDFMQEKQDPELNKCEYVRSIVQSLESVLRDSESSQPVNTKGNESIFEADIVVRQNVQRSVNEILQKSASIFELVHSGQVGIIGIVYDVTTGVCHVMDETSRGLGETSSIDMQRQ